VSRRFDWDPNKASLNDEKPGISFVRAADVFDDTDDLYELDDRFNYGEVRQQAIGRVGTMIIVVIFTERGALTRLISARKASRDERERYGGPRS
jgi:uncharacterized DUF497 family protein